MLNFQSLIDDLLAIINQFAASNRLEQLDAGYLQSKILQIDSLKAGRKSSFDFLLCFQERRLAGWLTHLERLGRLVVGESVDWSNAKLQAFQLLSFNGQASPVLTFTFDKQDFLARIFGTDFSLHSLFADVLDDSAIPHDSVSPHSSAIPHDSGLSLPNEPSKESRLTAGESTAEPTDSPINPSTEFSKASINRHPVLIITVKSSDEWSHLRVRCLRDWLAHIFSTFGASTDQLNFDSADALSRKLLGDSPQDASSPFSDIRSVSSSSNSPIVPTNYQLVYLILPHSTKLTNSAELISSWKNVKIIRAGRLVCNGHSDYAAYRTKLSEELRNEFDDETVDRLIRMKLLSHRPEHSVKLDLDYKQIVFLHYNYARIFCLIHRCSKIFNSNFDFDPERFCCANGSPHAASSSTEEGNRTNNEDNRLSPNSGHPQIKNSESVNSPLLKELAGCTFIEHFIGLSSFRFRLRIDQVELLGGRVQNQLVLLCNELSKYYQKRKVLDYSPGAELLSFKVNLLRSLLRLMDVYFSLLAIAPIQKI